MVIDLAGDGDGAEFGCVDFWFHSPPSSPAHQDALVADATGDALFVQVVDQGQGVFAAGAEQVPDLGDGDRRVFVQKGDDPVAHLLVGFGQKDDVVAEPDQPALLEQGVEDLAADDLFTLGHRRRGVGAVAEEVEEVIDLALLGRGEGGLVGGQPQGVGIAGQPAFGAGQGGDVVEQARGEGRQALGQAALDLLAGHAGAQRELGMVLTQQAFQPLAQLAPAGAGDDEMGVGDRRQGIGDAELGVEDQDLAVADEGRQGVPGLLARQAAAAQQVADLRRLAALEGLEQDLFGRAVDQRLELGNDLGLEALVAAAGKGVDDNAAADGDAGRRLAEDEAVAFDQGDRGSQPDLDPGLVAGDQDVLVEKANPGDGLGRAAEKVDLGVVFQRAGRVGQVAQVAIDQGGGLEPAGHGQYLAALHLVLTDAGEVDGDTAAGHRLLDFGFVCLQAADAGS